MAATGGILAQYNLTASSTWVSVFTAPSTGITVGTAIQIMVCNLNSAATKVTIALSTQASTPLNQEIIEYNATLNGFDVLERGGIILENSGSRKIFFQSTDPSPNLAITITGYEV